MRILLAEDDRMIGEAVHAGLKDAAYAVDWVKDGAMALRAAASENYVMRDDINQRQKAT